MLDTDFYDFEDDPQERYRKERKPARRPPVAEELAETDEAVSGLETTYKPSRFEAGWLLSSLASFYQQHIITDVLSHVKGGKEASVYCCRAAPDLGVDLIAAKVYRPRRFRNLRNDAMYREGRPVLTASGRAVKATDQRIIRALGKKSDFGLQVQHTSWLMYEYTTLETLFQAGAAVPQPFASSENALLMAYQGDTERSAPTLSEVSLEPNEAETLFTEVLRNIELMLERDMIHGDLSAYNILYWAGKVTIIDFPQVTNSRANTNARAIFQRDVTRICEYFAHQGVDCDPDAITEKLWRNTH